MNRNAYVLLLLTTLFWGGNAVAGKLAVGHVSPMLLTSARWTLALVILVAIGWRQFRDDWPLDRAQHPASRRPRRAGLHRLQHRALQRAELHDRDQHEHRTGGDADADLRGKLPVLFRLRVRPGQIVGFVLSIAGVVLTASHGDPRRLLQLDVNFGDALMVVAVVVYSLYTVGLRFKPAVQWQSLMIALTAGAAVTSFPFVMAEAYAGDLIMPDLQGWGVMLYTVLFPSILAQVFYVRAVEMIGANRAGLFINLVPIFGTLLSLVILGEAFHAYHAVAMVMVLGGIWIAEKSGAKAHDRSEGLG